jgi:hypothetical protein
MPWRLTGTLVRDGEEQAIVLTQKRENNQLYLIYLRRGDALPDGRVIVEVHASGIEVRRPGTNAGETVTLFQKSG